MFNRKLSPTSKTGISYWYGDGVEAGDLPGGLDVYACGSECVDHSSANRHKHDKPTFSLDWAQRNDPDAGRSARTLLQSVFTVKHLHPPTRCFIFETSGCAPSETILAFLRKELPHYSIWSRLV
jgi:hypothetical protein